MRLKMRLVLRMRLGLNLRIRMRLNIRMRLGLRIWANENQTMSHFDVETKRFT